MPSTRHFRLLREQTDRGFSIKCGVCPHARLGGWLGVHAYNPCMLHATYTMLGQAAMERLTLLLNHVLNQEPMATRRLEGHAGRCIRLQLNGWPDPLPALPPIEFRITAAGLLEWSGDAISPDPDLRISVDASNPARALIQAFGGSRPKVDIAGDAVLATDLNWLFANLRWDAQDDLARIVGAVPAREISRIAGGIAAGLREAVRTVSGIVRR